jgi:hypothetical protein
MSDCEARSEDNDIFSLENRFQLLDERIYSISKEKEENFRACAKRIEAYMCETKQSLPQIINFYREGLLNILKCHLERLSPCLSRTITLSYKPSKESIEKSEILLGKLIYKHPFGIYQKLRYFSFLQLVEINFSDDLVKPSDVHLRILVMSDYKIFAYTRTTQQTNLLRVFNRKWQKQAEQQLKSDLVLKNILSCGSRFVCLLFDSVQKRHHLELYDDRLELIANKQMNLVMNLCSMNEKEIICWNAIHKQCMIFNHKFEILECVGQNQSVNDPFFFGLGTLVDVSLQRILFYFYDEPNQLHFIRVIDRQSGHQVGRIDLKFDFFFTKMLRFDSESNILLKPYGPNDEIKLHDSNGLLLLSLNHEMFMNINRLDLTPRDEIQFVDLNRKKIILL